MFHAMVLPLRPILNNGGCKGPVGAENVGEHVLCIFKDLPQTMGAVRGQSGKRM